MHLEQRHWLRFFCLTENGKNQPAHCSAFRRADLVLSFFFPSSPFFHCMMSVKPDLSMEKKSHEDGIEIIHFGDGLR